VYTKPVNLSSLFKKYKNKWVAFSNEGKVVCYGNSLGVALKKAHKLGYEDPTVMKIPNTHYSLAL